MIKLVDKFSQNLSKKTVIVMAQASIHTRDSILKKLEEWKLKKLEILGWPTYSPKLNIREMLWRFIKYE